jgi:hypothetical protein
MPAWMEQRATHILAKNPSMPKSEAFALATQQMHALGKSPEHYGTEEGREKAKAKFPTPGDDKKTANPGKLMSPKMEKKAIVGPLVDYALLGIPSAIGGHLGAKKGIEMANEGKPLDRKSHAAEWLLPGAIGYRGAKEQTHGLQTFANRYNAMAKELHEQKSKGVEGDKKTAEVKQALIERLVRLGAQDIPKTPRLLMKRRGPEELAQLQQGVTNAFGKVEAPLKRGLEHLTNKLPEGKLRSFAHHAGTLAIENPETIPMHAIPVPGVGLGWLAAKKGLERGIDRLSPVPKLAFTVSQYSGALNPVISSGASGIPPFKAPSLGKAIQKTGFAQTYSAGPSPDWAHGPATAASGIPPFKAPRLDKAIQKSAAGAPTRGGFMMASDIPSYSPPRLDRAIQKNSELTTDPMTSEFKGGDFEGKKKEKDGDALPEGMALQPWDNFKPTNINAKHAYASMSTEKLAEFVEELMKEAIPGLTPQSRLEQSTRIGAPRATPPVTPSIADQSKPKGPGWGSGIAGANKGTIGGTSVGGIGEMKAAPQL